MKDLFTRLPENYTHVSNDPNHWCIPKYHSLDLASSGAELAIYTGAKEIPLGPFGLWSPINGGTIIIHLETFSKLRWYDRVLLLILATKTQQQYDSGDVGPCLNGNVRWFDREDDGYIMALELAEKGYIRDAADKILNLPWLNRLLVNTERRTMYSHRVDFVTNTFLRNIKRRA